MKKNAFLFGLICLISVSVMGQTNAFPNENIQQRAERMKWWTDARFGMFIHWGLYSQLAGEYQGEMIKRPGEWIMYKAKIPVKDYEKLTATFNPTGFNADTWVKIARDAGMKYIVITAKHCDGFAMFDSKATSYNIVSATPFKRDPMKELSEACKKYGIRLGFYYSHNWDWHEPNALGLQNTWDFPHTEGKNADIYYNTKVFPQVKELVTKYNPSIMWFDVPTDITKNQSLKIFKIIKNAQPDCIINDRISHDDHAGGLSGKLVLGDYHTPEQYIPKVSPGNPFEVCMTMNETWGYMYNDHDWKSAKEIIHNLIDITSNGGNYLLNVGPTGKGIFPPQSVKILRLVGEWMHKNGESIHGSSKSPFEKLPFEYIRCTAKPGELFIHLTAWPQGDEIVIPKLKAKIKTIYFLTDSTQKRIPFQKTENDDLLIKLDIENVANEIIDPFSTTLIIKYAGELHPVLSNCVVVDPAYPTIFDPMFAFKSSDSLQYGFNKNWDNLGYSTLKWTDTSSFNWGFRSIHSGNYVVKICYGADINSADNDIQLEVGNQKFLFRTKDTGGWFNYHKFILGKVKINSDFKGKVTLSPKEIRGSKVMNIKSIILSPIIK